MSTALEAASLIMIPTSYSDGLLASAKPNDGTGDFTFSRGSNISATRVNADGYIEKGYENLLLQSNTFLDAAWTKTRVDLTSGQTGYDGTNDAWLVTNSNDSFPRLEAFTTSSGVSTYSVYVKAGTNSFCQLRTGAISDVWFDLSNGSIISASGTGLIDTNSEEISNGWHRLSLIVNGTLTGVRIYSASAFGVYGLGSIYIQDAMVNQGMVAYPYVETTTAPVAGGILEDMPRLDYTDSSSPALLVEPQRTNLTIYSEYFETGGWFKSNTTITSNDSTSPEGLNNASLLVVTNVGQPRIEDLGEVSTTYSVSIFVKKSIGDYFGFGWYQGDIGNNYTRFNISTGTWDARLGSAFSDEDVVDYGNGWYRISAKLVTSSDTSKSGIKFVAMRSTDFSNGNIGDEYSIYGAQVEQDATYPTSYIPTYGVSQTRLVDVCNDAGDASTFNSLEGVLYFEGERLSLLGDKRTISISDGSVNNYLYIQFQGVSNTIRIFYKTIEFGQVLLLNYNLSNELGLNKYAFRWSNNNFSLWINGTKELEQLNGSTATSSVFSELNFALGNGLDNFYGNVKQVLTFNTALSDDECIALTTI